MESHSEPLQAFLGGVGLALSVHSLLVLNGSVLGVSGFIHRSVRGDLVAALSVFGMILGGAVIRLLGQAEPAGVLPSGLPQKIFSGLLVGMGTKLANGCTSGHMIAGVSRFSKRSFVATAMFFLTGIPTAGLVHGRSLVPVGSTDWSLGRNGVHIAVVLGALVTLWATYLMFPAHIVKGRVCAQTNASTQAPPSPRSCELHWHLRLFANLLTSFAFSVSLHVGNMVDPRKVLSFLVLPTSVAFDPTIAYLAAGALPLSIVLYRYARANEEPLFTGQWTVPRSDKIDKRLLAGSAMFGVGWGLSGICPGPILVNLGLASFSGGETVGDAAWLVSMVFGGFLV
ncbi:hypothetical protein BV22DRAFT_1109695 [Leucogyrophana mollusca]|uniref:Uncharacterized protein n=1 Tax=Leucogyrophana mollusca TaxID=85980 RepID=A0ACB8BY18_9AGAM|nr:hypothetical protein BV22DRAFT_1109695 [Leucogyrophana mollusca]